MAVASAHWVKRNMAHRASTIKVIALLASAFLAGCARHASTQTDLTLPSGAHVAITDVHGDSFANVAGVNRHIYYIAYETEHAFDDIPGLRKEALQVWAAYVPEIAGSKYDSFVITPMKRTPGGSDEGRPFYLTRHANGSWSLSP